MRSTPASGEGLVRHAASALQDPQGRDLAAAVRWWRLPSLTAAPDLRWPVAVTGQGPPLLLLHGFDSSFLEFRRLAPLLAETHTLVIPDLFGFGFTPRPAAGPYGPSGVLAHLEALLEALPEALGWNPTANGASPRLGVIGASMGGAVALELARRCPEWIHRLLLLDPAGLTGRPQPLVQPLAALGVRFLSLPWVRRGLTRSAFADPRGSVGPAEEEIASLHLQAPGWADSLARFARSGGFAGCGDPLPPQAVSVLWGDQDKILGPALRRQALALFGEALRPVPRCGHLPHLDQPKLVRDHWCQLDAFSTFPSPSPSPPGL
ncbi:MAG: alpha/beta fold hydrolase [Cyanobacteriota bacterium]|nr:alpha/beta fold hydrolase [Cyanobacteriota bacterium]